MAIGHVDTIDLKRTRNYATADGALKAVEKALATLSAQDVIWNVLLVQQDGRHVPILNCWRAPNRYLPGSVGAQIAASRSVFLTFM